jgi:hypothetical protein
VLSASRFRLAATVIFVLTSTRVIAAPHVLASHLLSNIATLILDLLEKHLLLLKVVVLAFIAFIIITGSVSWSQLLLGLAYRLPWIRFRLSFLVKIVLAAGIVHAEDGNYVGLSRPWIVIIIWASLTLSAFFFNDELLSRVGINLRAEYLNKLWILLLHSLLCFDLLKSLFRLVWCHFTVRSTFC